MVVLPSSRAAVALGLGLVGLGLLAAPSLGQQDARVNKAATSRAGTTPANPPAPAAFGTVDMTAIFKGYDKVKVSGEEFKAAVMAKKNELMQVMTQMQTETEILAKLTPNSPDF